MLLSDLAKAKIIPLEFQYGFRSTAHRLTAGLLRSAVSLLLWNFALQKIGLRFVYSTPPGSSHSESPIPYKIGGIG